MKLEELVWDDKGVPRCPCGSADFNVTTWEEITQIWHADAEEWGEKTGDGEIKPPHDLQCGECDQDLEIDDRFLKHIRF